MGDLTGGHPQSTPQVHLRDTATVALEGQDTQCLKKHDISANINTLHFRVQGGTTPLVFLVLISEYGLRSPRIVIFNVLFLPFPTTTVAGVSTICHNDSWTAMSHAPH